ncbi:MAG: hypothetical protein AAGJ18_08545 [Bacteroidota bacterium]
MAVTLYYERHGEKTFRRLSHFEINLSGAQIVNFKPNYTETVPVDTSRILVTVSGFENLLGFQTTIRLEQASGEEIVGTGGCEDEILTI